MKFSHQIVILAIILAIGLLYSHNISMAEVLTPELKIFDAKFQLEKSIKIEDLTGFNLAVCDLGGDGIDEIILAASQGFRPEVKIYTGSGELLNNFLAYSEKFMGGVEVACGDLDGDGQDEIVTGAGRGGGPHVRVLDGYGRTKINSGFYAYDLAERNGIKVAVADLDGNGVKEVVTSSYVNNQHHLKVFTEAGQKEIKNIFPADWQGEEALNIAGIDLGGDGRDEIIVGANLGNEPKIQIYNADGLLLNEFKAYVAGFKGGVNVSRIDKDNDGKDEILTGAGYLGGPHIRIMNAYGQEVGQRAFLAYHEIFKGGVSVAAGDIDGDKEDEVITVLDHWPARDPLIDKSVLIDISSQTLTWYYYGLPMEVDQVSSGTWTLPTPLGEFAIIAKSEEAYSRKYNLFMPYWMQFTYQGHGMHGLPFWKYSWGVVYEGVGHLGKRVSHGCVRLSVENAKRLYEWAPVGTKVVIQD